ncbi:MAG: hypothetical protein KCHDKBKB_01043 [Elusimicrobia bacterium]|nr:hypothetical protein [Elusimicrobiota bacterium]
MPFATEHKIFGFKKEASRGVAEASPSKFLAVGAETELNYSTTPIPDEKIRGFKDRFPSAPGLKEGTGTLATIDIEASTVGDLLYGCLGAVATAQPDAPNSPTVYRHTFSRLNSVQMPSFTFFADRGLSKKRYPLTVIKKLALSGAVDGKGLVNADLLFRTEEASSPFVPNYGAPKPLMFFQTDFKIDGVSDLNVKSWTLNIDNGSVAHRTLNQSRDVRDILSPGRFLIDGGFEIYFESEAQRQKFLDTSQAVLDIILTGDIIEDTFKNQLEFVLPEIRYTAFPFGNLDDLLGAAVTFEAQYNLAAGYSLQAILTNAVASY